MGFIASKEHVMIIVKPKLACLQLMHCKNHEKKKTGDFDTFFYLIFSSIVHNLITNYNFTG